MHFDRLPLHTRRRSTVHFRTDSLVTRNVHYPCCSQSHDQPHGSLMTFMLLICNGCRTRNCALRVSRWANGAFRIFALGSGDVPLVGTVEVHINQTCATYLTFHTKLPSKTQLRSPLGKLAFHQRIPSEHISLIASSSLGQVLFQTPHSLLGIRRIGEGFLGHAWCYRALGLMSFTFFVFVSGWPTYFEVMRHTSGKVTDDVLIWGYVAL